MSEDKTTAAEEKKAPAKDPAPASPKAPTILVTKVEVSGLGKFPLRVSEVGGKALGNGAVLRLPVQAAQDMCAKYPANCKIVGATGYNIPTEEAPADFRGEVLNEGKAPSATATGKAEGPSGEGKAANKNLAKAPATKG